MRARTAIARLAREESGLSLIELLVTIFAGIVVVGALFAIQQVALFQTNRVFARVDATQHARNVFETISSRVHSSCIADGVTPIQPGSTGTSLQFISKYGGAATLTPQLHVISLTGTTLTDTTYSNHTGASPNWTFQKNDVNPPTTTLLTHASQSGTIPVFQYFDYDVARDAPVGGNAYLDSAGNPYVMLLDGSSSLPTGVTTYSGGAVPAGTIPANSPSPLPAPAGTGLSSADANSASAVVVTLRIGAEGNLGSNANYSGSGVSGELATFSDTMVLRLTPPPSDRNPQAVTPCA